MDLETITIMFNGTATNDIDFFNDPSNVSTAASANLTSVLARHGNLVRLVYRHFMPDVIDLAKALLFVWLFVGIVGNALSAKIWMEKRMRQHNSSAVYVAALPVNSLAFLLFHVVDRLLFYWDLNLYAYPVVCEAVSILYFVPQYLSQLLVLAFTVDRYIVVCHPLRRKDLCRPSRALKVTIAMLVGATLTASMQAFFRQYNPKTKLCENQRRTLLMSTWTWTVEMLIFLVVPLVTIVFNLLVIHGLGNFRRARRLELTASPSRPSVASMVASRKENGRTSIAGTGNGRVVANGHGQPPRAATSKSHKTTTTFMLLSISFFYVATTLPSTFVYIFESWFPTGPDVLSDEMILGDADWSRHFAYVRVQIIMFELTVAHYSCNFLIFLPTGRHFRQAFVDLLRCRRTEFVN